MQYFDEYQDIPIIRRVVDDEKLRQLAYDDYLRNQGPEGTYTVPFLLEVTRPVLQDFTKLWFSNAFTFPGMSGDGVNCTRINPQFQLWIEFS